MSVDGYLCLVSVILIAAACLLAVVIATLPDHGSRCVSPRAGLRPLARAVAGMARLDLWFWLASGQALLPPAPYVPPCQVAASAGRMPEPVETATAAGGAPGLAEPGAARAIAWSEDPERVIGVGWRVPDGWRLPGGRGLMFARPGKQPWLTGQQPAIPVPEAAGPDRAWDPGDGLGPDVPLARPYAPQPVYGEACQLDVAEAERRFALAMGPDGREEVR